MDQTVFKIGDIILGRIKGYPNWPGIIEKKSQKEEKEIKKLNIRLNFLEILLLLLILVGGK